MGIPGKSWSVRRLRHDPAFRRSVILLASASLLLLLAVGNLVAVAEGPPRVIPERLPTESWSAGAGTAETRGQTQWLFSVDPMGRRVVELEFVVPYRIVVTHAQEETSRLFGNLRVWADGEELARASQPVEAAAERAGEEWIERGELGERLGRVVLTRAADAEPFPLLVTWDWTYQGPDDATAYAVRVGPVEVEPVALSGLPGCTDTTCARILVIAALALQGVAVSWFLRVQEQAGKRAGPPAAARGRQAPATEGEAQAPRPPQD